MRPLAGNRVRIALGASLVAGTLSGALLFSQATAVAAPAQRAPRRVAASLTWSPSAGGQFSFAAVGTGQVETQTFTLTNSSGRATGVVTSAAMTGSNSFSITAQTCTHSSLGPDGSCSVTVEYSPSTLASVHATLVVTAVHATASLALSAAPAPGITVSFTTSGLSGYCQAGLTLTNFQPTTRLTVTYTLTRSGTKGTAISYSPGVTTDSSGDFSGLLTVLISSTNDVSFTIGGVSTVFQTVSC